MTFNENLKATTNERLAPKVIDLILTGNVLTMKILSQAKKWTFGTTMSKGVRYKKTTSGTSFSGQDTWGTNLESTKIKISFEPKGYVQPVVISGIERDVNGTDSQRAASVVALAMEEAQADMLEGIAGMFYGDESGNSGKDTAGTLNIIDDGSIASTYGGKARSLYPVLKAYVQSITGGFTDFSPLRTADMRARTGMWSTDLIITDEDKFNEVEAMVQPMVNLNTNIDNKVYVTRDGVVPTREALNGNVGFAGLYYRGKPIVVDEKATARKMYGINSKFLEFYGIPSLDEGYKPVTLKAGSDLEKPLETASKNMGISWSGLQNPFNQYGQVGHYVLLGQLTSFNPKAHFRLDYSA